jgi:hypothetical protein
MTEPVKTGNIQGDHPMSSQWTPEAIRALGATTDLPTLGSIFGVSRWRAYQMAHTGEWQKVGIRIVPIGTKYRVAVQSILEVLRHDGAASSGTGHQPSPSGHMQAPGNITDDATTEPSAPATAKGRAMSRSHDPAIANRKRRADLEDQRLPDQRRGRHPRIHR